MIDTHSHIYLDQFDEDRGEVLDRASEAGVTHIFMPAITFSDIESMEKISHEQISFFKMAGLHPADIKELHNGYEQELLNLCNSEEIYGVGETGLDYYWSTDHVTEQKLSLHAHCRVAKKTGKPIILHNRESTSDLLSIIEQQQNGDLTGIWHCFNGTVEEGKKAIDLGLHLGIGGVVTFKNGGVDKTAKELPLDKMVLETDAPYLSPTPKRGKRNEPSFMKYTATKLAEIFDKETEEIIALTTSNAKGLFNIG
jgi:TatD DNase family protein